MPKRKLITLGTARTTLKILRGNIRKRFGTATWEKTNAKIIATCEMLQEYPESGAVVPELAGTGIEYRQAISGMNRVIYEVDGDAIYIAFVIDTRQDLLTLVERLTLDNL
jgi:toxin ParE1/3/4